MAMSPVSRQQKSVTSTDSIMWSLGSGLCSPAVAGADMLATGLLYCADGSHNPAMR